jgi:hypothetical protein
LSPPVSSTPALTRSCLIPKTTMSSLSTGPRARLPIALGPGDGTRSVPPASPASKP